MTHYLGTDIGGTKIATGVFSGDGNLVYENKIATPKEYEAFLDSVCEEVEKADQKMGPKVPLGIGIPGIIDQWFGSVDAANLPWLRGKPLRDDLKARLGREVKIANDGSCLVLAEVVDGAGAGYKTVFGLIVGTGVGGGYVSNGQIILGANGLNGEIGHIALPFWKEEEDGVPHDCYCGQNNCVEGNISGPALARLYAHVAGQEASPEQIAELAKKGDQTAIRVLTRYYNTFAKAMVVLLHSFDPDAIVVSGGIANMPGFLEEVQKGWGRYCYVKQPRTKLFSAVYGNAACLRGAAWLWRSEKVPAITHDRRKTPPNPA